MGYQEVVDFLSEWSRSLFSLRSSSAERWAILESCDFQSTLVSGGRFRLDIMLFLSLVSRNLKREYLDLLDLEHISTVTTGPDAQYVFAISYTQNNTAYLVTDNSKLVTNYRQEQVFPVPIHNPFL